MNPSCANCLFFEATDDTCHRYAPKAVSGNVTVPWAWPKVNLPNARNWCGEWQDGSTAVPGRGTA